MEPTAREREYQALRCLLKTLSPAESSLSSLMSKAIEQELTPRQRQVVEMYYLRQMRMVDIASELGVNVSTVSRTALRGRKRLKRCLAYNGQAYIKGFLEEV